MKRNRNRGGLIATLLLAGILGTSAYAFTATNNIDPQQAGDGTAGVSGFDVSLVHFSIPDDPAGGTTVTFHINGTASSVKASGSDDGKGLVDCTAVTTAAAGDWTCDLNETLTDAENLRVAATN
jgi:hypothetical protein